MYLHPIGVVRGSVATSAPACLLQHSVPQPPPPRCSAPYPPNPTLSPPPSVPKPKGSLWHEVVIPVSEHQRAVDVTGRADDNAVKVDASQWEHEPGGDVAQVPVALGNGDLLGLGGVGGLVGW